MVVASLLAAEQLIIKLELTNLAKYQLKPNLEIENIPQIRSWFSESWLKKREMNQLAARPERKTWDIFWHEHLPTVIYQKSLAKPSAKTFANDF
jgi:hypothetical protein